MNFRRIALLLLLPLFIMSSCKNEVAETTQICVLIDITDERFKDEHFVSENLPKFLKLMNLDKNTGGYSGGEIKLSLINEVSDSKSKTIKLATGETGMMGENPLNRKDAVDKFYIELENSFNKLLSSANWGTDASNIYQKVTREIIKMKKSEIGRKYLVIYSDMLENSDQFSFYGTDWKSNIQKMIDNPESTLENLSQGGPTLPDLSEFEIFIVNTRTSANDEKINLSEQLWMSLFEYQGATVSFNSVLEV
jgi:hypothetical protein